MGQQDRLERLEHNLRTRNIYRVRELLIENLSDFAEDKEFLMFCYKLAKQDSLIFQTHDHELLEPDLERWDEEVYKELTKKLVKNFSQMRYYLGIQLSLHFAELKQKEREAEALLEKEKEAGEEKKEKKIRIKRLKREKRKRSDKEKHTLAAIHTTGFLLIAMIAQLIYGSNN